MKNNYDLGSMDLEVFLDIGELVKLRHTPLKMELMQSGEPLGERKLTVRYEDFQELGDGVRVDYLKSDPEGGWEKVTGIEVVLNEHVYMGRLLPNDQIIARQISGATIAIFGPEKTRDILGPFK